VRRRCWGQRGLVSAVVSLGLLHFSNIDRRKTETVTLKREREREVDQKRQNDITVWKKRRPMRVLFFPPGGSAIFHTDLAE
jgi:hypothetical protein